MKREPGNRLDGEYIPGHDPITLQFQTFSLDCTREQRVMAVDGSSELSPSGESWRMGMIAAACSCG